MLRRRWSLSRLPSGLPQPSSERCDNGPDEDDRLLGRAWDCGRRLSLTVRSLARLFVLLQQFRHVCYLLVYIATGSSFSLLVKRSSQDNGGKQPYEPVAGQTRRRRAPGR
jgi:hypothetical protein